MNVGIYFDLRNPPQWQRSWSHLYGFTLEMCEEAERLGCHSVWSTEHHLFDDGYMTQPLGFLAAVAARTKTVRLGTAIVIAPLHHPVEIAEQAAFVDISLVVGWSSGSVPAIASPSSRCSERTCRRAMATPMIELAPSGGCSKRGS